MLTPLLMVVIVDVALEGAILAFGDIGDMRFQQVSPLEVVQAPRNAGVLLDDLLVHHNGVDEGVILHFRGFLGPGVGIKRVHELLRLSELLKRVSCALDSLSLAPLGPSLPY